MISIIIPAKGEGTYLKEALESVYAQTFDDWECIIVDDGMSDNAKSVVTPFLSDRLKCVPSTGNGISHALNTGISLAQYDYIARLDDDDIWAKDHLVTLFNVLQKNKQLEIVSSLVLEDRVPTEIPKSFDIQNPYALLPYRNPLNHPTVILKKSAWQNAGKYRSECDGFEDYDLWARMLTSENSAICGVPTIFYRSKERLVTWEDDQNYLRFRKRLAIKFGLTLKEVWGTKW